MAAGSDSTSSNCNDHIENEDNMSIIWFDTEFGAQASCAKHKERLKELINDVRVFTDEKECLAHIQSVKSGKLLVITSGKCAPHFLPLITTIKQVDCVFIFCFQKSKYVNLKARFPQLIDICVNFESLYKAIQEELGNITSHLQEFGVLNRHQHAARDLSKECAKFLWFQLAKYLLIRLPSTRQSRDEMLRISRHYYRHNPAELTRIAEFENTYQPENVIHWYTRQSFVYKLVNKALRCEDIDQLLRFGFFIVDLSTSLVKEHKNLLKAFDDDILIVYRGVTVHKDELEQMKRSVGQLIATNGFWSTSMLRGRARAFAGRNPQETDLVSVLFEITCHMKSVGQKSIFADISKFSKFPAEKEVLFDLSTCFRIDSLAQEEDIWIIKLSLSDDGENIAQSYFKEKRSEIENASVELMLGVLMCEIGQHTKSHKYFEQLLMDSKNQDTAWIELNIGRALFYQGELVEARKHYDLAYEQMMKTQPQRIKDSAAVLNNIGVLLQNQGELEQAAEFHQKALKIRDNQLPPGHVDIISSLNNMGTILHQQGRYDTALDYHRRALRIRRQAQTWNHLDCATSLSNIGTILADQGKYSEAHDSHQQALTIRQSILTSDHPDIAESHNNIGSTLYRQGKFNEALNSYKKAHDIRVQCLPSVHPNIAHTLNNIGNVMHSQKRYKEAIDHYRRALLMQQECLPAIHLDVACSLSNIGHILCVEGNYIEGLESFSKALEIQEKCHTTSHPDVAYCLNNMGIILNKQRNEEQALTYFERALQMQKQCLPEHHPAIADSLNNIALIRQKQRNYEESLALYQQSLAIKEKCLSKDHPSVALSLLNIGNVLRLQEKYSECLSYYTRAHEILQIYSSSNDPDIADSLYCLGTAYTNLKEPAKALDHLKRALEIYKTLSNETERRHKIERYIAQLSSP